MRRGGAGGAPHAPTPARYPTPDFATIHTELARSGVARMLLWQEYRARHPDGCRYSAFCRDYDAWRGRQNAVMRFDHAPGDKLFVDYAGLTMSIVDRGSGEAQTAQIFVAALGAHVRALEYLGGVTQAIVPDNLKSGVSRACRYEPDLNPSYQDWAAHCGVAVLPARVQVLSTVSTTGVEEVNAARGEPVWYQLYLPGQWTATQSLTRRVGAAGCPVPVNTVDDVRGERRETLERFKRLDTRDCTVCHGAGGDPPPRERRPILASFTDTYMSIRNKTIDWEDIRRTRDFLQKSQMKIVIKDIVTAEDARPRIAHGMDGTIVSNHGGREDSTNRGSI